MKPAPAAERRAPLPRRAILWIVVTGAAYVLNTVCAHLLVGGDIFAAVLGAENPEILLAAVFIVPVRLYLYLLAPGWALYITVRTVIERRARLSG